MILYESWKGMKDILEETTKKMGNFFNYIKNKNIQIKMALKYTSIFDKLLEF